ncbi:FkbM family methyltransferase [Candidatus Parcubacteria bacterium]|nr:MAG: FkbM family methyltransferase [Candidatus Parcubacteria bacterium]
MDITVSRVINFAIRWLQYLSETGLDPGNIERVKRLRISGINYSRYLLFNKKWLIESQINTVIDIGANVGEFTAIFAELFPNAKVYAFEPLPDCFELLNRVAKRYRGRVKAFNIAIGEQKGSFEFYRSSWAPASSFREMGDLHKKNYPHSVGSETVTVEVETLDSVFRDIDMSDNVFVKMDVQGFEDEVIKGGLEVIGRAKVLVIECSLQQTYEGEPMFHGIYSLVRPMGFEYRGSLKQSVRRDDESFLQADCIFIRV